MDGGPEDSLGSWSKRPARGDSGSADLGAGPSISLEEAVGIWKQLLGSCRVARGRINTALKESIRDN